MIDCLRMSFRAAGNPSIGIELMQWANAMGQMGRPGQKEFLRFGLQFIRQALLTSYQTKSLVHYASMNAFFLIVLLLLFIVETLKKLSLFLKMLCMR